MRKIRVSSVVVILSFTLSGCPGGGGSDDVTLSTVEQGAPNLNEQTGECVNKFGDITLTGSTFVASTVDTDGGTDGGSPVEDPPQEPPPEDSGGSDTDGSPIPEHPENVDTPPTSTGEDDPDTSAPVNNVQFTDATESTGIFHGHSFDQSATCRTGYEHMVAGVAAGDYDSDGDVDLYFPTGNRSINRLYRNNGDGTFTDVADPAGVGLPPEDPANGCSAAPLFFDYDGDGHLDLLVNAINGYSSQLFRNKGDGSFQNVTTSSALFTDRNLSLSASAADYDRDGDLDLFLAHWGSEVTKDVSTQHLWRNEGNGTFTDTSVPSGISATYPQVSNIAGDENSTDFTFTPNFADVNNDGWPDLLIASDFGTSQILLNARNGTFVDVTPDVISDENGMGAAVEDYDNDGDLDWFVSSILDPDGKVQSPENWGTSGNRLYKNDNGCGVTDATAESGVRDGSWGWGSCFADFNNDGWLDIFHVNGFATNLSGSEYGKDLSRLFISNKNGTFTEYAVEAGINDDRQGRGISCFDYDRDGDVDIFIANNNQPARAYRNESGNQKHYLSIKLKGKAPNTDAIGARIYVTTPEGRQMREIKAGNNYLSQNPTEVHFGLEDAATADVHVRWPDGSETTIENSSINRHIVITQ